MTAYIIGLLAVLVVGLLVERHLGEQAHRRERERMFRLILARHVPEFVTMERLIGAEPGFEAPTARRPGPRPAPADDDERSDRPPAGVVGLNGN